MPGRCGATTTAWASTQYLPSSSFRGTDCSNDVGVVDWLNSAAFHFFPETGETGTIDFTLAATGTHLFDEGYTYLSIQWDKLVTDKFGPTGSAR